MTKILEILKQRVDTTDSINSWLFTEAQSIISKSANHLKYVARVMPEFDLHDSSHSASVLEIIENLLGDTAEKLSSFELFFIIASSYLHDCGMAISDYEKKVMELTEGTDDVYTNENSLKNDVLCGYFSKVLISLLDSYPIDIFLYLYLMRPDAVEEII